MFYLYVLCFTVLTRCSHHVPVCVVPTYFTCMFCVLQLSLAVSITFLVCVVPVYFTFMCFLQFSLAVPITFRCVLFLFILPVCLFYSSRSPSVSFLFILPLCFCFTVLARCSHHVPVCVVPTYFTCMFCVLQLSLAVSITLLVCVVPVYFTFMCFLQFSLAVPITFRCVLFLFILPVCLFYSSRSPSVSSLFILPLCFCFTVLARCSHHVRCVLFLFILSLCFCFTVLARFSHHVHGVYCFCLFYLYVFVLQFSLAVPITFLVCVTFLLIVPLFAAPYDTGMGMLIVASGIPVYLIGVSWKKKPKSFSSFIGKSFWYYR